MTVKMADFTLCDIKWVVNRAHTTAGTCTACTLDILYIFVYTHTRYFESVHNVHVHTSTCTAADVVCVHREWSFLYGVCVPDLQWLFVPILTMHTVNFVQDSSHRPHHSTGQSTGCRLLSVLRR